MKVLIVFGFHEKFEGETKARFEKAERLAFSFDKVIFTGREWKKVKKTNPDPVWLLKNVEGEFESTTTLENLKFSFNKLPETESQVFLLSTWYHLPRIAIDCLFLRPPSKTRFIPVWYLNKTVLIGFLLAEPMGIIFDVLYLISARKIHRGWQRLKKYLCQRLAKYFL